jgi:hypothetical protein
MGLENLASIEGNLGIGSNAALTSLAGLENLASIEGNLGIGSNDALTSLAGLENLNSIGESLTIGSSYSVGNPALTSLAGLENLNSIGGGLKIRYNDALTSLAGLENLNSIGGGLEIRYNDALTSLMGLENIAPASITYIWIHYNSSLSTCEIQSICEYLATHNGWGNIRDNAPGCNSPEEVEEACLGVGVDELSVVSQQSSVRVFPNPTSEIVHLEFEIQNPAPVCIQVFNAMGEMVADLSPGIRAEGQHRITWNTAHLPAGLYFCKVIAGKESAGLKLIKQ